MSEFIRLFEAVAACEAPEGTQVDDVLAEFQAAYDAQKAAPAVPRPRPSDHPVIPESAYGDDLFDNCSACGEACTSDGKHHGSDGEVYG